MDQSRNIVDEAVAKAELDKRQRMLEQLEARLDQPAYKDSYESQSYPTPPSWQWNGQRVNLTFTDETTSFNQVVVSCNLSGSTDWCYTHKQSVDHCQKGNAVADALMPPHEPATPQNLKPFDEIVVLVGEQRCWRGVVQAISTDMGGVVRAKMTRPNGSKASTVDHRMDCVGKILAKVPEFRDAETAEAWLESQLPEAPPEFAVGAVVIFSCPPHLAQRIEPINQSIDWKQRFDDLECRGRVTKYMPRWNSDTTEPSGIYGSLETRRRIVTPGYELLVLLDGEPEIIEVAARRIKRLA